MKTWAQICKHFTSIFNSAVLLFLCFHESCHKNACNCLQIFDHVFINRPQNCTDLVSFACWIVTEFWSFTRQSVPRLVIRALNRARFCVVCALNCAQILVVRTLFTVSSANLNLAGTLDRIIVKIPVPNCLGSCAVAPVSDPDQIPI